MNSICVQLALLLILLPLTVVALPFATAEKSSADDVVVMTLMKRDDHPPPPPPPPPERLSGQVIKYIIVFSSMLHFHWRTFCPDTYLL